MWAAQIVVNHVPCRVIGKRIPSPYCILPLNKWSSHSLCKIMQSLHFRIQNMHEKCTQSDFDRRSLRGFKIRTICKSGGNCRLRIHHLHGLGAKFERWEPSKPWRVVSPVFGGEPSATPKKTPPFSQSPKKWGSLLEPIETFTACLQLPFQTCPISNPLGRTFSQKCSSIDLET